MRDQTFTVAYTIERGEDAFDVKVYFTWTPGCRGSRDGRFGPPLEPDEPAGIEEIWVEKDGKPFETTAAEDSEILSYCENYLQELGSREGDYYEE